MADLLISARNLLVDVNRPANTLAASTIASSEDPLPGLIGNAKTTGSQPAQLSTLGGFKNALAEFRNAAATLAALAKILALKPLFTDALPEAVSPEAAAAQTVDAASLFAATRKPAPGSDQNPVTRPALPLNDGSLLDADLPQARLPASSPTGATVSPPATPSRSAVVLTQAIQTFVAAHNRLIVVLTPLADPGTAPALESPAGAEEIPEPGQFPRVPVAQTGVTQRLASTASEFQPSSLQSLRVAGQPSSSRVGEALANAGNPIAFPLTATLSPEILPVGKPSPATTAGEMLKFTRDPTAPKPTTAQPGGNGGLPNNIVPADLGKRAQRLLDTLTVVTTPKPTTAQPGGNGGLPNNIVLPDLGKQAQRLLDTLTGVTAPKPTTAQPGGNGGLPNNIVPADLGKQARRLLDTLTAVTARLPGLQAVGLTSGQDGELRLDAGRLQAAIVVQPRTIAKLFSTIDFNPDQAQSSSPALSSRPSGAATAASPLATLNAALTDFQEKTRIVTGLARLLTHPTPVAERSSDLAPAAPLLKTTSGEVAPAMTRTAPPVSMAGLARVKPESSAPAIETLYLNQKETLLSTALLRSGDRLAPMTLQFQAGRFDALTQRFLAEPQQSPVDVALSDANDTLPGLRDAIQARNPDLGAAVVKDNAGYRLAMRLPGETLAHSIAVTISKAANSPTASEGQPLGFTVQRDADAVRNAVQSLVGAYNRLNSAAGSLSGDLQAQALAGPLQQSLAGTVANPGRGRALAQAGVIVQRDGSLLIEPVRLSAAATTHPKEVLNLFADHEGGEEDESGSVAGLTDSFADGLSEIRDTKEPWDSQLDDQSLEAALNPDGGQGSEGWRNAAEIRYRIRLETVNRLTQRLFSTELWLRQELERLSGSPTSAGVIGIIP
jgi:flagellar capping protein FliD